MDRLNTDLTRIKSLLDTFGLNNIILSLLHIYQDYKLYSYISTLYYKVDKSKNIVELETFNMLNKDIKDLVDSNGLDGFLLLLLIALNSSGLRGKNKKGKHA